MQKAIKQSGPDPADHEWKWKITKVKMKKLWEEGLTDNQILNKKGHYWVKHFCKGKKCSIYPNGFVQLFSQANTDDATVKEYHDLVLGKIHFRLAELIIGVEKWGQQWYIHT